MANPCRCLRPTNASSGNDVIDIGVNLTNSAFDADRADVLQRAAAAGVTSMLVTGTSVAASQAASALAEKTGLYATAGVHPHDAEAAPPDWPEAIASLAQSRTVVAIGETGLDYYRNYSSRDAQRQAFQRQAELAVAVGKPLFVHDRDSGGETRAILADYRNRLVDCVIHCFTGTAEDLDGYLQDGYHIGITGWICDERRGGELAALAPRIPADRLMIETDAPFLLPRNITPKPSSRRNEPAFLPWVVAKLAECRSEDPAALAEQTQANARRFFRLAEHGVAAAARIRDHQCEPREPQS